MLLFHGSHGNSPCNVAMLPIALETESRVVDAVEVDIKKTTFRKGRNQSQRGNADLRCRSDLQIFMTF